jgi:hypothetical protein
MMAALSRFISKLDERGMPFYSVLRKADGLQWDEQAVAAFIELSHGAQGGNGAASSRKRTAEDGKAKSENRWD